MSIAATIVCLIALAGLLHAERRGARRGIYATKPLASLAFIAVALGHGATGAYGKWILVGLVLGAVGDVALMFKTDRAFLAGLVAFLLGHVAYVVAFAGVTPPSAWLVWAIVPIVGAAVVLRWLWPHLGKLRIPVILYVVVITAMATGGLAAQGAARHDLTATAATLLTLGALFFFASDIAVARDKFVASGFVNRAWGLPAYYGGQLLLAWSLA
ncbi:MAG: lysoplasmalogenase [Polyangiaceae bacterium]